MLRRLMLVLVSLVLGAGKPGVVQSPPDQSFTGSSSI